MIINGRRKTLYANPYSMSSEVCDIRKAIGLLWASLLTCQMLDQVALRPISAITCFDHLD